MLHSQILGMGTNLRIIVLAEKKIIKYQNQMDLLKTHEELSSHSHHLQHSFLGLLGGNPRLLSLLGVELLPVSFSHCC